MNRSAVFLELGEEFGGTRFGPLDRPEFRIGSGEDNDIRVAEALGVDDAHCRLAAKSDETFYLAPVSRSSAVWLTRQGASKPALLHGPTVVRPGDAFSLVAPEGIRFHIVRVTPERGRKRGGLADHLPDDLQQRAGRFQRGLVQEVWRRIRSMALQNPIGRYAQQMWFMVKTGQILSPVYVIGFLTTMSGWGFSLRQCNQLSEADDRIGALQQRNEQLEYTVEELRGGRPGDDGWDWARLVSRVHDDDGWALVMAESAVSGPFVDELRLWVRKEDALDERWYAATNSPYALVRKALEDKGVPPPVAREVAWTAIRPGLNRPARPHEAVDAHRPAPPGDPWCVRGLFRVSFAQATRLGVPASEDFYLDDSEIPALLADPADFKKQSLVRWNQTRIHAGLDNVAFDERERSRFQTSDDLDASLLQTGRCFFRDLELDERDRVATVARALADQLGERARGLPGLDLPHGVVHRLARLFAFDLAGDAYGEVDLAAQRLSLALDAASDLDPTGTQEVFRRVAEHAALSTAIPCLALLEGGPDAYPTEVLGPPPPFEVCAVLVTKARQSEG